MVYEKDGPAEDDPVEIACPGFAVQL